MAAVSELDWPALRRPLRNCGIAALPLLAFLAFWQFAVPGDTQEGGGLAAWVFIIAAALLIPCGLGLPISAGRRLWRAGRRRAAFGPVACLLLGLFGLPYLIRAAEGPVSLVLACLPLVLLAAATGSGYVIVSVRGPPGGAATKPLPVDGPHGDPDINPGDPSGYARDVPAKREPR